MTRTRMPSAKPLRLTPLKCELLDLRALFRPEDFDAEAFLSAISPQDSLQSRSYIQHTCTTRNKKTDYHVHLYLTRPKMGAKARERDVELELRFHQGPVEAEDTDTAPFAEDVIGWCKPFFRESIIRVRASARFDFPRTEYNSALKLPLAIPAILDPTPNNIIAGGEFVGMRLRYPQNDIGLEDTIQEVFGNRLLSVVSMRLEAAFSSIEPVEIVAKLHQAATVLVRRTDHE